MTLRVPTPERKRWPCGGVEPGTPANSHLAHLPLQLLQPLLSLRQALPGACPLLPQPVLLLLQLPGRGGRGSVHARPQAPRTPRADHTSRLPRWV